MNFPSPSESSTMGRKEWWLCAGILVGGRQDETGETWCETERQKGESKLGLEWKKLCKMPVSYLLRCIKFPVRLPVLYKIMLMSCCPLRMAACWSWACVAGRYTECTQWDSAFLLRKTSRHLMMNSLSPNVPLFCVENMSAFLNYFREPCVALCGLRWAGEKGVWGVPLQKAKGVN